MKKIVVELEVQGYKNKMEKILEQEQLPKLLKPKDIQKHLGIGKTKVYELFQSDGFASFQIGNQYYIEETEYIKWLHRLKGGKYNL